MFKVKCIILGLLISIGNLSIASGIEFYEADEIKYACTDLDLNIHSVSFSSKRNQNLASNLDSRFFMIERIFTLELEFHLGSPSGGQIWSVPARGESRAFENLRGQNANFQESNLATIRRLVRNTVENGLQNLIAVRDEHCNSNDESPLSNILDLYSVSQAMIVAHNHTIEDSTLRQCGNDICIDITRIIEDHFLFLAPEYGFRQRPHY